MKLLHKSRHTARAREIYPFVKHNCKCYLALVRDFEKSSVFKTKRLCDPPLAFPFVINSKELTTFVKSPKSLMKADFQVVLNLMA